ncbi:MAG: hypothetical protein IKZ98_04775 [Clostridia bacterium]|nr:hypothetical protein [Clostridia bacterium]
MKRTVKVLMILLVCIQLIASAAQAEPLGFGFVNARDVAVRGIMGGRILDRLPKDTCVWIRDARTDRAGRKWYEINAKAGVNEDGTDKEQTGWMRAEFIDAGNTVWHDVESVAASDEGMLALRTDGTVEQAGLARPDNADGQSLRGWAKAISDIQQVGICGGGQVCYAVGRDGTCYDSADAGEGHTERIYTAGGKQRIWEITTDYRLKTGDSSLNWIYPRSIGPEELAHVAAVADNDSKLLLLTDDGKVYAASWQQAEEAEPEPDWEKWTDVVSLEAASCRFTEDGEVRSACAAVRKDGTVLAAPAELSELIGAWTDMAKIVIGENWVLGLKRNGTVLSAGMAGTTPPDVSRWSDIMDLGTGRDYCVGVKSSGSVVFAGDHMF